MSSPRFIFQKPSSSVILPSVRPLQGTKLQVIVRFPLGSCPVPSLLPFRYPLPPVPCVFLPLPQLSEPTGSQPFLDKEEAVLLPILLPKPGMHGWVGRSERQPLPASPGLIPSNVHLTWAWTRAGPGKPPAGSWCHGQSRPYRGQRGDSTHQM